MEFITLRPREISDVLINPGMGWTTFYSFNGDEINKDYPKASIAYFRFYWDQLEPEEGKYRWEIIDELLQIGKLKEQKLALRIMAMDGLERAAIWRAKKVSTEGLIEVRRYRVPEWFYKLGCRGKEFFDKENWAPGTPAMWEPDYSDPIFLEKHSNFIAALGHRYDGHPGIDHVDIGSVGRWGEWHSAAVPMPSFAAKQQIIDAYISAFKKTPLLIPIGDVEALSYAVSKGTGWRADCLGDCRHNFFNPLWEGGTPDWNHMEDVYLKHLVIANALKSWKKAPVAFETCWSIDYWKEQGWPIDYIFDYALALHVSILNNKSLPIPEEWWPQINDFSRKMGYRFVLKELSHQRVIYGTSSISLSTVWENKGVAPCYHKYLLAFRLRSVPTGKEWVTSAKSDLTGWLPGTHKVEEEIKPPADFPKGFVELSVGVVDPRNNQPVVNLAIEGRDKDGWYPVSSLRFE